MERTGIEYWEHVAAGGRMVEALLHEVEYRGYALTAASIHWKFIATC